MRKAGIVLVFVLFVLTAVWALAWNCNVTGEWDVTVYSCNDVPPVYHMAMSATSVSDIDITAVTDDNIDCGAGGYFGDVHYTGIVLYDGSWTMYSEIFCYPDQPGHEFQRVVHIQLGPNWKTFTGSVYQYMDGEQYGEGCAWPIPITGVRTTPYPNGCAGGILP